MINLHLFSFKFLNEAIYSCYRLITINGHALVYFWFWIKTIEQNNN